MRPILSRFSNAAAETEGRSATQLASAARSGDGTVSVVDMATLQVTKMLQAGTGIETLTYY